MTDKSLTVASGDTTLDGETPSVTTKTGADDENTRSGSMVELIEVVATPCPPGAEV